MNPEAKKIIYDYMDWWVGNPRPLDGNDVLVLMQKMVENGHWYQFYNFVEDEWSDTHMDREAKYNLDLVAHWLFSLEKDNEESLGRFFDLFIESEVWKK